MTHKKGLARQTIVMDFFILQTREGENKKGTFFG